MKKDKLPYRLKEFYLLERLQLNYYQTQLSSIADDRYRRAFERLVVRETEHTDYFKKKMDEANISAPIGMPSLAAFAGTIAGEVVELTGPSNICKVGIAFERKAVEMYQAFILESADDTQELRDALWYFMIDEEMHLLWMNDYLERIQKMKNN